MFKLYVIVKLYIIFWNDIKGFYRFGFLKNVIKVTVQPQKILYH
jgi:hypothetical protein